MLVVGYLIIAILFFCALVYWNKKTDEYWDEVILGFYCMFSILWVVYAPLFLVYFFFKWISKLMRGE